MSSDLLRQAASEMRERAEAAARWADGDWSGDVWTLHDVCDDTFAHAASWHPAVALAVADWLDATARELDSLGDPDLSRHPLDGRRTAALAVARAYLGSDDG